MYIWKTVLRKQARWVFKNSMETELARTVDVVVSKENLHFDNQS